ncbi:MAG: uracil-DNA glycosylase [Victivallaceae bacterium]|nr:uracil-DNA glycosylase [Victivallaceae bacterium]
MDFFEQLAELAAAMPRRKMVRSDHPAWQAFLADRPAPPETADDAPTDMGTLAALGDAAKMCRACPLGTGRLHAVFGEGDPHAKLMFIGEGPGADEDASGRPFVGRAGQLLDKMIAAMQFRREEVYIANVVKCRPPGNRAPTPEEAQKCAHFLEKQIGLIKPEVIVLLGASAAKYLLRREEGITRLRGRFLEYRGIPVMPTYHPAFLLRQESAKRDAWSDLQQVMAKFGKYPVKK